MSKIYIFNYPQNVFITKSTRKRTRRSHKMDGEKEVC